MKKLLTFLALLISFNSYAQWANVTGTSQKNTATGQYRWNFAANGIFDPNALFVSLTSDQTIGGTKFHTGYNNFQDIGVRTIALSPFGPQEIPAGGVSAGTLYVSAGTNGAFIGTTSYRNQVPQFRWGERAGGGAYVVQRWENGNWLDVLVAGGGSTYATKSQLDSIAALKLNVAGGNSISGTQTYDADLRGNDWFVTDNQIKVGNLLLNTIPGNPFSGPGGGAIDFNSLSDNLRLAYNPGVNPDRFYVAKNGSGQSRYIAYTDDLANKPDSTTIANTYAKKNADNTYTGNQTVTQTVDGVLPSFISLAMNGATMSMNAQGITHTTPDGRRLELGTNAIAQIWNSQGQYTAMRYNRISYGNNGFEGNLEQPGMSANRQWYLPDETGVLATRNYISSFVGDTAQYFRKSGGNFTGRVYMAYDAVNAMEPITKGQFDNALTGITWKQAVRVKTNGNITLSGTQTIDGVAVSVGNRVLVNSQTNLSQNGIYLVQSGAWIRVPDADTGDEISQATVAVTAGSSLNKNTQWTYTGVQPPTLGTDDITFGQISGAGTYTNGTYLTLTGNVFDINVAAVRGLFSASNPLVYNNGAFSINQASISQDGYLSSTDFNTFNNKQSPASTLAGYGITDAYTKTQSDASYQPKLTQNNEQIYYSNGTSTVQSPGMSFNTALNRFTLFNYNNSFPEMRMGNIPTATGTKQGDYLFNFVGFGANAAGTPTNNASGIIRLDATEDYTTTAQGSMWRFFTYQTGTTTQREPLRLNNDGSVLTGGALTVPGNGFFTSRTSVNTALGTNAPSALYIGTTAFTTSGAYTLLGFGVRQDALTYNSNAAGTTISQAAINSYGQATIANANATTITKMYGNYFRATAAGANTTITTNYAAGFGGDIEVNGQATISSNTIIGTGSALSKFTVYQSSDAATSGIAISNAAAGSNFRLWMDGANARLSGNGSETGNIILNGGGTGRVLIRTTTDNGTSALQVGGDGVFTGNVFPSANATNTSGTTSLNWLSVYTREINSVGATSNLNFRLNGTDVGRWITSTGNLLIGGTTDAGAGAGKLQVVTGDARINTIGNGLILRSPNGTSWRLTVSDAGAAVFTSL